MTKRLCFLAALLLWAAPLHAQILPPSPQSLTAQFSSTCAATTCATWPMLNATSVTVSVSGAGSWTGTFYASSDGGNTYFTASMIRLSDRSTTTTATDTGDGQYAIVNSGITHLQFRLTTWASGGANVWAIRGYGSPVAIPFSSGGGPLLVNDGTCAAPSYSFLSDPTQGLAKGCLVVKQGTLTADAQALSTTATWNNAAVTFTHWKANVVDTLSNAASLLIDLQVGAASKFSVDKTGILRAQSSIISTNGLVNASANGGLGWTSRSNILSPSDGVVTLLNNAGTDFSRLQFGGTTTSFPSLARSGTNILVKLADGTNGGGLGFASMALSGTAPTVPVACTSPTVTWSNGTATFQIDVGTSCTGVTTLAFTMPAATNGWQCVGHSVTAPATSVPSQSAGTTTSVTLTNYSRTTGLAIDWADAADIRVQCSGG